VPLGIAAIFGTAIGQHPQQRYVMPVIKRHHEVGCEGRPSHHIRRAGRQKNAKARRSASAVHRPKQSLQHRRLDRLINLE
jgi:hypothetical protein